MPTFQSIHVHPNLKLIELIDATGSSSSSSNITTPQALLSRRNFKNIRLLLKTTKQQQNDSCDCDAAVTSLKSIPIHQIEKLRWDVATALIQRSNSATTNSSVVNSHNNKPSHSLPGTISAYQLWKQQQQQKQLIARGSTTEMSSFQSSVVPSTTSISTGCKRLNELLASSPTTTTARNSVADASDSDTGGGIPYGYITEICGTVGSGKTQLALQIAINAAAKQATTNAVTIWYFTSGTSTSTLAKRIHEMLSSSSSHDASSIETVLTSISIQTTSTDYELLQQLHGIETTVLQQKQSPVVIIIDSCSDIFATSILTTSTSSVTLPPGSETTATTTNTSTTTTTIGCCRNTEDQQQHRVQLLLKRISRYYGAAVVVVNGSVPDRTSDTEQEMKPALLGGKYAAVWDSTADIRVWLQHQQLPTHQNNNNTVITVSLLHHFHKYYQESKHTLLSLPKASFCITKQGIHENK